MLRPHTILSKIVQGGGSWAVSYPAFHQPSFAVVLEGPCWLSVEDGDPAHLSTGDFVLFPTTPGFKLASAIDAEPTRLIPDTSRSVPSDITHGDGDQAPSVRLLGGWFAFDQANQPLVVALLPRMLHVRASDPAIADITAVVALIRRETATNRPGGSLVLTRLLEVLLVEAIRSAPPDIAPTGLLAGLRDPQLAGVLRQIYAQAAEPWTLGLMARSAGMSRSAFTERFSRIVGQPPLSHLQHWRMAIARDMLTNGRRSVAEVAFAIGYQSASAFSTAFSRHVGRPPRDFMRSD